MVRLVLLSFAFILMGTQTCKAQNVLNPDRNKPLEILVDETLEWHRNDKQYIARGNVKASQGETTIFADILTADYREGDKGDFEIFRLTASGNVRISSEEGTAYGDKAVYNVDRGVAVMTGNDLKLISETKDSAHTLTSNESFEYWITEGRLTATGDAKIVSGEDILEAETVSAYFRETAEGNRALDRFTAQNNVVITTPMEVLKGNEGIYHAGTEIAMLEGDVTIQRGDNLLEGAKAEVNLLTNVSTLFGRSTSSSNNAEQENTGRIRGVFYPGSIEKTE